MQLVSSHGSVVAFLCNCLDTVSVYSFYSMQKMLSKGIEELPEVVICHNTFCSLTDSKTMLVHLNVHFIYGQILLHCVFITEDWKPERNDFSGNPRNSEKQILPTKGSNVSKVIQNALWWRFVALVFSEQVQLSSFLEKLSMIAFINAHESKATWSGLGSQVLPTAEICSATWAQVCISSVVLGFAQRSVLCACNSC